MGRARKTAADDTPAPAEGEPAPEAKPKRAKKADAPAPTTAGRLASLLKTARDTMRKDKGLNGDLDRLPLLTWLMFLKFLDDKEADEESRAKPGPQGEPADHRRTVPLAGLGRAGRPDRRRPVAVHLIRVAEEA